MSEAASLDRDRRMAGDGEDLLSSAFLFFRRIRSIDQRLNSDRKKIQSDDLVAQGSIEDSTCI
jgi:hypothetical protein